MKFNTLFLFTVLILGMAAYPTTLNPTSLDESSQNTSFLTAFAQEEEGSDEDSDEEVMEDANDAITDAQEEINKAQKKIDEAADEEKEITLAQDQLNEAILKLEMAQASFDSGDYEEAEELADEAEDLASESRGKLIGKTEADLEDDGVEEEDEKEEDEIELKGILTDNGNDTFDLKTGDGTETISINDDTEIDDDLSLSDLDGLEVEVDVVKVDGVLFATEIEFEEKDDEDEEEDEIKIKAEVEDGVAKVKVKFNDQKHRFLVTDNPSEDAIADAILELPNFPLDKAGIIEIWDFEVKHDDEEDEIEIEVEVEDGVAKVKVKFNDQKHRFLVTDNPSEDAIADAILELPDFPLDKDGIIEIWDFEVEEESSSLTTTEFDAYEAEQEAQELYDDLQDKINDLEERIQDLLEKYENGEYYGKVHEIDSEIMSYAISFTGFALSHDDDSVSSMDGTIYVDSLITGSNISKYAVTGGEISIDDIFYEFIFGKVRVTSSGNVVLIGQVMNWADENDDSSTIKLVIRSDVPLEDGFGSESINIEILPQSKIAGLWFLSGTGSLVLTGSSEPVDTSSTVESNVTETEYTVVEDIPHTTALSVSTLQQSYVSGDEIVISGTVAEIFENTPVVLQTVTTSDLIDIAQIDLSSNGEFTHSIQATGPQWQTSDTYTVKAFYGGNNFAQTTFEFSVE